MNKILEIQQKLKAPKNLYNSYGGYSYRSAETILEALKPILVDTNTYILINDELTNIGERYYVRATVTLYDGETDKVLATTTASAREEETKKGMDGSQITGASSSYARKYALNGMFAIDDIAESDKTNTHGKEENTQKGAENKTATREEKITNKPICPICGKETTAKALETWGCCSSCKKKGS